MQVWFHIRPVGLQHEQYIFIHKNEYTQKMSTHKNEYTQKMSTNKK